MPQTPQISREDPLNLSPRSSDLSQRSHKFKPKILRSKPKISQVSAQDSQLQAAVPTQSRAGSHGCPAGALAPSRLLLPPHPQDKALGECWGLHGQWGTSPSSLHPMGKPAPERCDRCGYRRCCTGVRDAAPLGISREKWELPVA